MKSIILWLNVFVVFELVQSSSLRDVEEQFVDGEFPYWPYNRNSDKYSLEIDTQLAKESRGTMKSMKKRDILPSEVTAVDASVGNSVKKRNYGSNFYDVKKRRPINIATIEAMATTSESEDTRKIHKKKSKQFRYGRENNRAFSAKEANHHPKVKRANLQFEIPFEEEKSIQAEDEIQQRIQDSRKDFLVDEKPAEIGSQLISAEDFIHREEKTNPLTKPVSHDGQSSEGKIHNFNSWLSRELEKIVRLKDPRMLDFMADKGKYNGVMIDTKHSQPSSKSSSNMKIIKCIDGAVPNYLQQTAEHLLTADTKHSSTLWEHLSDNLTELEPVAKAGSSLEGEQRESDPHLERLAKIRADKLTSSGSEIKPRDARSAKVNIAIKPEVGLAHNDLLELKKNLHLVENKPLSNDKNGEELDLKDLRLHIKVFVENSDDASKKSK